MKTDFDWLLFDIGGVLVEFSGVPKILEWMNWQVDREEMNRRWLCCEAIRAYETGKIGVAEFSERVVKELEFTVCPEEFIKWFSVFPKGLYRGAGELLQELSGRYSIATLSNISEMHWDRLCVQDGLEKLVKTNFLSFKTGCMKPDMEAFQKVITDLKCDAGRIIFFDDNRINVEAAAKTGMKAVCVDGFDGLVGQLTEMEII